MRKDFLLLMILITALNLSCAAFPGRVKSQSFGSLDKESIASVKFVFTGFSKYAEEKEIIYKSLNEIGFTDNSESEVLLEIILEELEPKYENKFFHFINLIFSIGTGTVIPYRIHTDHRLSFRWRKKGVIEKELEVETRFHQFRGVSMIFLTYFYWPSRVFKDYLAITTKQELIRVR